MPSWFIVSSPSSGSTFLSPLLVLSHLTSPLCLPITCVQGEGATGPSPAAGIGMEWVGRDGAWDFPAHPIPSLSPYGFTYPTPNLFPWPLFPGLSTPFPIVWPATYSCTGPHWWSRQSQCLCFLDSGCRSSGGSRADRSPWHSGYSDGCWCCSSDQGSIGLQARGKKDRS